MTSRRRTQIKSLYQLEKICDFQMTYTDFCDCFKNDTKVCSIYEGNKCKAFMILNKYCNKDLGIQKELLTPYEDFTEADFDKFSISEDRWYIEDIVSLVNGGTVSMLTALSELPQWVVFHARTSNNSFKKLIASLHSLEYKLVAIEKLPKYYVEGDNGILCILKKAS
jgi:hypothetical protein